MNEVSNLYQHLKDSAPKNFPTVDLSGIKTMQAGKMSKGEFVNETWYNGEQLEKYLYDLQALQPKASPPVFEGVDFLYLMTNLHKHLSNDKSTMGMALLFNVDLILQALDNKPT